MEDNREYSNHHHDDCFMYRHPVMRHLCIACLTFLGAFAAFYVVTDWHYKRMLDPAVQMRKMEKMFRADENYIEKMAEKQMNRERHMTERAESFIRLEKADKSYKVVVDLRPFDNDEKNVEVSADGHVLTVSAAGAAKKHGRERILKVTQNYLFDDDVDLNNMTKIRQGKDLVIYIPTEK